MAIQQDLVSKKEKMRRGKEKRRGRRRKEKEEKERERRGKGEGGEEGMADLPFTLHKADLDGFL